MTAPPCDKPNQTMPAITLPDGSIRRFEGPVTGAALAADIGPGLARAALAMKVDGKLLDLARPIEGDAAVTFVTRRDPDALELIRHDAAHVLAEAVQSLYPGTQVTIGPAIDNGFYYDFARNDPFTPDDFPAIEGKMREIVARNAPFEREVWDRDEAIRFFEDRGERYKAELIRDLPESETITLYKQGDWIDLCRGPHMRGTGDVGTAFKLMKVAGAYWRGDHRNAMLSRIYGTAWRDAKELEAYLHQLEEAERRDHRRIGRQMDLFHMGEEAVGSIFWHPKGWRLYRAAESYMRRRQEEAGYLEIKTPQLVDRRAVGGERALGELRRAHVHRPRGGRGHHARAEADELPVPCAGVQGPAPLLSRAAAAPGRVRLLPPLRALRRAARHHAGAGLHPGRRAHLLHRGPDRPGDGPLRRAAVLGLSRLRLRQLPGEVRRSSDAARRVG